MIVKRSISCYKYRNLSLISSESKVAKNMDENYAERGGELAFIDE